MSPREFWNAFEGWTQTVEFQQKQHWERARYMARAIVSVQVAKKDRSKLDQAFALPWDQGHKSTEKKAFDPDADKLEMQRVEELAKKLSNGTVRSERNAGTGNEKL